MNSLTSVFTIKHDFSIKRMDLQLQQINFFISSFIETRQSLLLYIVESKWCVNPGFVPSRPRIAFHHGSYRIVRCRLLGGWIFVWTSHYACALLYAPNCTTHHSPCSMHHFKLYHCHCIRCPTPNSTVQYIIIWAHARTQTTSLIISITACLKHAVMQLISDVPFIGPSKHLLFEFTNRIAIAYLLQRYSPQTGELRATRNGTHNIHTLKNNSSNNNFVKQ